jgi:hypothetical protein
MKPKPRASKSKRRSKRAYVTDSHVDYLDENVAKRFEFPAGQSLSFLVGPFFIVLSKTNVTLQTCTMADNDTTMEEQLPSTPAEAPSTPMDDAAADTENLPPPRLIITKMVRTKKRD